MNARFGVSTVAAILAVAGLGVGGVAGYRLVNGQCPLSGACIKDSAAVTTVGEKSSCCALKEAAGTQTVALTEETSECTGAVSECTGAKTACHGEKTEGATTVLASETTEAKKSGCCQGDSEKCEPADCEKGKECCKEGEKKEEVASGGDKPATGG